MITINKEELDVLVSALRRLEKRTRETMPHYEAWCDNINTFRLFVDVRMRRLPETEDEQIAYLDSLAYVRSAILVIYEAWVHGQPRLRDLNRYYTEIETRLNGTFSTQWNTIMRIIGLATLETLYQE